MSTAIPEPLPFAAPPSKASAKAEVTDHAARAIIGEEEAHRKAKTEKLRQARLAHEAELAEASEAPKATKKASAPKKKTTG